MHPSLYFDNVVFTLTEEVAGTPVDVSCSATGATLSPDTPVETRNKLCGKGKAVGETDWTLELDYDQDWDLGAAAALSFFLVTHEGQEATAELSWEDGKVTATATVLIVPGTFGGTAGEVAEASIELPVLGQPTFEPIAGGGATATEAATEAEPVDVGV